MRRSWLLGGGLLCLLILLLFFGGRPQPQASLPAGRHPLQPLPHYPAAEADALFSYRPMPLPAALQAGNPAAEGLKSPYPEGSWGGLLRFSMLGTGPKTFNPWAAYDAASSSIGNYLGCGLVTTNVLTGAVKPWIAKRIEVEPNQRVIHLTLLQGLRWSDGVPLTSEDVLFTWNVLLKKGYGNPSMRDILTIDGQFPEVTASSPTELTIRLPKPFAPFLQSLATTLAPKHVFAPIVAKGGDKAFSAAWNAQAASEHPERLVSCGPWVLQHYEPGQYLRFARNPQYFVVSPKQQKRLPYAEGLLLSIVKDPANRQLLFEQGGLHSVDVTGKNLDRLRVLPHPEFTLWNLGPAEGSNFIAFNLNTANDAATGKPLLPLKVQRWLGNRWLRQAMNHSINRKQLVATVLRGVGTPAFSDFSPTSPFANPQVQQGFEPDIAYAKELLKQGGFRWDAQGRLLDAQGEWVELELATNADNPEREATVLQLVKDWQALGLNVHPHLGEFNALLAKMGAGQWQLMMMGLTGSSNLEPHWGANVWLSSGAIHLFKQRKPHWSRQPLLPWEATLDRLYEAGASTLVLPQRQVVYRQVQAVVAEQAPMLYLFNGQSLVATRSSLQNVYPTAIGGALHNVDSLWLKE